MNSLKFRPEGWNNEITPVNKATLNRYMETNQILQGLVKKCDENYNLYVEFKDGLTGVMPRREKYINLCNLL